MFIAITTAINHSSVHYKINVASILLNDYKIVCNKIIIKQLIKTQNKDKTISFIALLTAF